MKRKKITAAVLFAVSGILLIGFTVKTCIDGANYARSENGAPFMLRIAVNALCFAAPSAVAAGAALFTLRKTRALGIFSAALWALSLLSIIVTMLNYENAASGFVDGLLCALPFSLTAIVDTVLAVISRRRSSKTEV